MKKSLQAIPWALLCCAVIVASASVIVEAAPQDPAGPSPTSLERVKDGLETPVVRPLAPASPVRLRPVFKSSVEKHPWVLTLDEELHKTFDLSDSQRQSAAWAAQCCGIDLVGVYKAIRRASDDRLASRTREQIARELAELQAARAAAADK